MEEPWRFLALEQEACGTTDPSVQKTRQNQPNGIASLSIMKHLVHMLFSNLSRSMVSLIWCIFCTTVYFVWYYWVVEQIYSSSVYVEGDIEIRIYNKVVTGEVMKLPEICVRYDGMSFVIYVFSSTKSLVLVWMHPLIESYIILSLCFTGFLRWNLKVMCEKNDIVKLFNCLMCLLV